jgi:GrpB-like predicted nucleotidyltransferase (UPF0157 family)
MAAIAVAIADYDPAWPERAEQLSAPLAVALGDALVVIHHIGSTAVPGLAAKPVIDLLPVVRDLAALDARRTALEGCGYVWRGENGIPGRRYCTLSGPDGARLAHVHCFEAGSPDVDRHLAVRDYLRAHPDAAVAYSTEKRRVQRLYPDDSLAYSEGKSAFVRDLEQDALGWFARERAGRHTGAV